MQLQFLNTKKNYLSHKILINYYNQSTKQITNYNNILIDY